MSSVACNLDELAMSVDNSPQCTDELFWDDAGRELIASIAFWSKMAQSSYRLEANKPNDPIDVMEHSLKQCLERALRWDVSVGSTGLGLVSGYTMRVTTIYQ